MTDAYDQRWRYRRHLPERYGQRCRVLVRGRRLRQIAIEFEADGERYVTIDRAVEPVGERYVPPPVQGRLFA
jgi:hypothetical protein